MPTNLLVSVICPDRVGLVAALTGRLFDLGANLADTTFAVLGEGAEFTAVAEFTEETPPETIEAEIRDLPELEGADVSVTAFTLGTVHGPMGRLTHRIVLSGGDRPGLIARLSELFGEFDANIVRLNSERIPGKTGDEYVVTFGVSIPEAAAPTCLATVDNTAGELGLTCRSYAVHGEA
jgi:glycine cleavage system transcriptional repressor